jgi:hypothetical protein
MRVGRRRNEADGGWGGEVGRRLELKFKRRKVLGSRIAGWNGFGEMLRPAAGSVSAEISCLPRRQVSILDGRNQSK